jgi:UDP-glucose 4-epimerase
MVAPSGLGRRHGTVTLGAFVTVSSSCKETKSMSELHVIAGGAGFIGVNLTRRLLDAGAQVLILDNLSRGRAQYLDDLNAGDRLKLRVCDLSQRSQVLAAFEFAESLTKVTEIWHFAANSDIPAGVADPDIDLRNTFLTTFELLRAMRVHNVGVMHFASSSAVYGDLGDTILVENVGPLQPISNYGAMKLASEAQATAAAESGLQRVNLFRFPNVVGVPATHGVIMDFAQKLRVDPSRLEVLGDGTQQKAYLHVSDLVDAMLAVRARPTSGGRNVELVNIGPTDTGVQVRWIAQEVVARMSPGAKIIFGKGNKGWVGDVPKFNYSTDRLQSFGWAPKMNSEAALRRAIDEIAQQHGF